MDSQAVASLSAPLMRSQKETRQCLVLRSDSVHRSRLIQGADHVNVNIIGSVAGLVEVAVERDE